MAQEVVDVQGRRTEGAGHVLLLPQRLRESSIDMAAAMACLQAAEGIE